MDIPNHWVFQFPDNKSSPGEFKIKDHEDKSLTLATQLITSICYRRLLLSGTELLLVDHLYRKKLNTKSINLCHAKLDKGKCGLWG